jgi:hypothetical protein
VAVLKFPADADDNSEGAILTLAEWARIWREVLRLVYELGGVVALDRLHERLQREMAHPTVIIFDLTSLVSSNPLEK